MKRFIDFTLIIPALLFFSGTMSGSPRALFAYSTFSSPGSGPFIETYLNFDASSLRFTQTENNDFQATVEILMVFKQDDLILDFRKYELISPSVEDTLNVQFSFTDQQRFLLPNGNYLLELSLSDVNNASDTLHHTEEIVISFKPESINISTIQLVERAEKTDAPGPLTKSGYDIYPFVDYFYPASINSISFYAEIYDAAKILGQDENVLITSSIETFETKTVLSDYNRFKREVAREVNVILNNFDISRLPSGNYFLVVSMKDRENNTLVSNRVFFQRLNPELKLSEEDFQHVNIAHTFTTQIVEIDSLTYFIKALGPISTYSEREFAHNIVSTTNLDMMQRYFYNFWLQRDPANPQNAWKNYYIEMCRADANFKTRVKRGYETDRGRVFLQYGTPNSITQSYDEPNSYPYEIWHYYAINGQRDKRFVFYSRDLSTNDFELIHSDVVGELANPRWNLILNSRNPQNWNVDSEAAPDHWGGKSRDYFDRPR